MILDARAFAGVLLAVGACGPSAGLVDGAANHARVPIGAACLPLGDAGLGGDDSRCEFPQSCLGGGTCDPGSGSGLEGFDVRAACLPPEGMCYVPGAVNGVADGECVFPSEPPDGRETSCRVCDPASPWGLSALPDGNECNDGNNCTRDDTCASGICAGICDESLPGCDGECDPD